jgi:hypothetical protein
MPTETLEKFFLGKLFAVPPYQRDYAWIKRNVDEFFEDLAEAIDSNNAHYIGTFVLSKGNNDARYKVVDGQQRLTTLTMLISVLTRELSTQQAALRDFLTPLFLREIDGAWKLLLLGQNHEFFHNLIQDKNPEPSTPGQERLKDAYNWIKQWIAQIRADKGDEALKKWLNAISHFEVLEFVEPNEGKAIRMFQSVNDRGIALSYIDKMKSLLIYYSNRLLNQELDEFINDAFGRCFCDFSVIQTLAGKKGFEVDQINRATFSEDDILRYHYLSFDASSYGIESFDYSATIDFVLNFFMKPALKRLSESRDQLHRFVKGYTEDLAAFFSALRGLIEETRTAEATFQLFVIQNVSASLYPLLIRLRLRGLLGSKIRNNNGMKILDAIETTDLRVYKTRGTDPVKGIFLLARKAGILSADEIANELRQFVAWFMDDATFRSKLGQDVFHNAGINRMLMEYEILKRKTLGMSVPTISELNAMNADYQTVEHILPQQPDFGFPSYGFSTQEEYDLNKHRFGNLTLLEKYLNSRCQNQPIESKIQHPDLYRESKYQMTLSIAAAGMESPEAYRRHGISRRSDELIDFCASRWPLWAQAQ